MMMKKVGVVGGGAIAQHSHISGYAANPEFELAAIEHNMKKQKMKNTLLLLIIGLCVSVVCAANDSMNIALGKKYILSDAPNYVHCTDTGDIVQLTDGKFAGMPIWVDKATVGWQHRNLVSVTVDLEKEEDISGVAWSTAGGASGVTFPEGIFVYISKDSNNWVYIGDLTDENNARNVAKKKEYDVFKYTSNAMRGKGRYVRFDICTTTYIFCDELEIYHGEPMVDTANLMITDTVKHSQELLLQKKAPKTSEMNLAVQKKYTLSPAPNYWNCTDEDDIVQLTDGKYSIGNFWTQKSTVGWSYYNSIDVTVDLEKQKAISGFSWNSAAGAAGVEFPLAICVYVSNDGKIWDYAGELVALGTKDRELPQGYNVFKFSASGLQLRGRYVRFHIITNTQYVFVDEIEILKGDDSLASAHVQTGITDIAKHSLAQLFHGVIVRRCQNELVSMRKLLEALPASAKSKAEQQIANLSGEILSIKPMAGVDEFKAIVPLNEVHGKILGLNSFVLHQAGYSSPFFWNSCRWDNLDITAVPPNTKLQPLVIDMMRREIRGDVINICNPTAEPITYLVSVNGLSPQANIVLKEVLFTDTRQNEVVASALKPAGVNQPLRTIVPAGCNRQIWISVQKPELAPGSYKATIAAAAENAPELKGELVLNIHPFDYPAQSSLHTGGWDYLHLKNDDEAALHLKFLREELCADVAWADYKLSPQNAQFNKEGNLLNPEQIDFSGWDKWISVWKGARYYCFFWGGYHNFGGFDKNDPLFKHAVGQYLKCWAAHIRKQGIEPSQVLLLIVDEPGSDVHYDITVKWAEAIRASETGFGVYSDPSPELFSDARQRMFDSLDVICPNSVGIAERKDEIAFLEKQRRNGRMIWLYACDGPAKLLDPVSYYRLQAWRAFSLKGNASLFWQFGDTGGSGNSFWPYTQCGADYCPYFSTPREAMHGKQSEACREGMEDFEYLTMLQKKIESSKDKATVEKMRKILDDAVEEALSIQVKGSNPWSAGKNRAIVDQARLKVLNALK